MKAIIMSNNTYMEERTHVPIYFFNGDSFNIACLTVSLKLYDVSLDK